MTEVLQTNIFFIIMSISVVVLTIFIGILLYHAIKLVRVFGRLADMIETEASEYVDLSSDLREGVRTHPLVKMFVGTKDTGARRSKRAAKDISK